MVAYNSFVVRDTADDTAVTEFPLKGEGDNPWPDIQSVGFLSSPNRDIENQTQVDRFNGESNLLDMYVPQMLLVPPLLAPARESFDVKQKWEGYVLEVGKETFLARLVPLIGEDADLEAEIYLEEIDREDRELVTPGAVFYWSIGYLKKPSGTYRTSLIRFRRLPSLSAKELKAARIQAQQFINLFNDEQPKYSARP
ncbi:MAG: hypothetical protein JXA33_16910 [Anaerolineae bacterium]|nr:hypothetical protein [Anaerolineae bacterium]